MLFNERATTKKLFNRSITVKSITLKRVLKKIPNIEYVIGYNPQYHLNLVDRSSQRKDNNYRFKKFKLDLLMPTYKLACNIDTNLSACNFVTLITQAEQLRKVNVVFDNKYNKKYEEYFETVKSKTNRINFKILSFIDNYLLVITVKAVKSFKVAQNLLDQKWTLLVNLTDTKMQITAKNDDSLLNNIKLTSNAVKVYQLTISKDEVLNGLKNNPVYNVIRNQKLVTMPIEKLLPSLNGNEIKLTVHKKALELNLL